MFALTDEEVHLIGGGGDVASVANSIANSAAQVGTGLACVGGVALTMGSAGVAAIVTGAITTAACVATAATVVGQLTGGNGNPGSNSNCNNGNTSCNNNSGNSCHR